MATIPNCVSESLLKMNIKKSTLFLPAQLKLRGTFFTLVWDGYSFKSHLYRVYKPLQNAMNLYTHMSNAPCQWLGRNLNPLSAIPTKWSNTLKQFAGKLPTNCWGVFDHFIGLTLKGLKLVSAIFSQIFIFHQIIALQKLWKMFFHLKRSFHSRDFVFPCSPLFLPVSHWFRGWSKINLKVYDVIICLTKNLITHFVWYLEKERRYDIETLFIDRVLNKKHFYGKIMPKTCTKS